MPESDRNGRTRAVDRSEVRATASPSAVGRVLDAVLTFGAEPLNQKQLAVLAQVAPSTLTNAKKPRQGCGSLLTSGPVRFTSEMGLVLAVSVGAERIRAGLVDANGSLLCRRISDPLRGQLELPQLQLLKRVGRLTADVLETALTEPTLVRPDGTLPVFAAMMALPTPIDRDHRQVNRALPHGSWADDKPFRNLNHAFAAALGGSFAEASSQVMNDCNAAAVALAFDHVRQYEAPRRDPGKEPFRERSTIMAVRVGGGVGCGIIEIASDQEEIYISRFLRSRVMVGTHALAGEIGHMPISQSPVAAMNDRAKGIDGLRKIDYRAKCACGQLHHLQALIGAAAFARRLGLKTESDAAPLMVQLEPHLHDGSSKAARQALRDAGELLGKALVGPVLALDLKGISVIGALAQRSLVEGLTAARSEWGRAFDTGARVDMIDPGPDAPWMITRGAGLAMMRQHRHRKLREIGKAGMVGLLPSLDLDAAYVKDLRLRSWS